MITIGIDPGLGGAIALFDGQRVQTWPIPTHEIKRGRKYKNRLDDMGLLRLARALATAGPALAAIEDVGGMPRQSASGAFTFGDVTGAIRLAFLGCGVPVHKVHATTWKAHINLKGDKDDARAMASRFFPDFSAQWARKTQDGQAEAALIAKYARDVLCSPQQG